MREESFVKEVTEGSKVQEDQKENGVTKEEDSKETIKK